MTDLNRSIDQMWDQVGHDLGWHDHSMDRTRPYNGQPHTMTGTRGATEIKGITFRDLRDAFIRAYIMSHNYYQPGTIKLEQPNAALIDEAGKGDKAAICENDLYGLVNGIDPMAVAQNLGLELEKLMGIYPNVPELT